MRMRERIANHIGAATSPNCQMVPEDIDQRGDSATLKGLPQYL